MLVRSVLLLLVSVIAVSQAEHIVLGSRVPGDELLGRSSLTTVERPRFGNGNNQGSQPTTSYKVLNANDGSRRISEMKIVDKGNGCGTIFPINGGPGSNFVVLQAIAPPGCSVDYSIELYGQ